MERITNYNIKVLKWAVEKYGNGDLHLKFPGIDDWIEGNKHPTANQLADFSKASSIPFGYFFLDSIPDLKTGVPLFRTRNPNPTEDYSSELSDTIKNIQNRQEWLKDYLQNEGAAELNFVGSFDEDDDTLVIARAMRSTLKLADNWADSLTNWENALKFLFDRTEAAEIFIAINGVVGNNTHRTLNPDEFRGFVLTDSVAPYIFINGKDFTAAKMFTLAHELAHIWLGKTAAFDLKNMQPADHLTEKKCNEIAAEFLVPRKELIDAWSNVKDKSQGIEIMANKFKVSQIVAARRLLDTNKITSDYFREFYTKYLTDFRSIKEKKKNGGDFYNNQNYRVGKRFFNEVNTAAKEGKLLYTEAYKLTGLYGRTYTTFEQDLKY